MSMEPMLTIGDVREKFLIKRVLDAARGEGDKRAPLAMFGSPGIGKTQSVKKIDEVPVIRDRGVEVENHIFHLAMEDPTTVGGLLRIDDNGRTTRSIPDTIPPDDGKVHVVFYDDFNAAPRANQAIIYSALTDWMIGNHQMPTNTVQVLAGNLPDDKAIVNAVSSALVNRCCVVGVYPDALEWCDWAMDQGFPDVHVGCVARFKNEVLMGKPIEGKPWPSPRAHENLFREVADQVEIEGVERAYDQDTIAAFLGPAVAQKFHTFLEYDHVLRLVDDVESGSLGGNDPKVRNLSTDERYVLGVGTVNALEPGALVPWLLDWEVDVDVAAFMSRLAQRRNREATIQALRDNTQRVGQKWKFVAEMELGQ